MNPQTTDPPMELSHAAAYDVNTFKNTMVLNNGSAKAIVFALKAGQDVPPHSSPTDALITVLEGQGTVKFSGMLHVLRAGGYVVMPKAIEHHIQATSDMKFLLVK